LSQHQPEGAIEALRPALAYDLRSFDAPEMRGRAYLAARKPEPAAIEFRKIIDHPGVDPMSHYLPLAHLGLARAYAMQGNVTASRGEYQKLLAMWKDSDADLPARNDAYLELAHLR
jgi:Tfp pilus assembly protein PilF